MRKVIVLGLILMGILGIISRYSPAEQSGKRIGIVVPIEHQAMKDMTDGFIEKIGEKYGPEVAVAIQNAQGDGAIQKAIIENYKRKKYDIIVPIGTDVTLMTQNIVKEQPILGLDVTNMVTQERSNVTGVRESPIDPSFTFIKLLIPHLKKITMVYSASDKNYEMVQVFQDIAGAEGVDVQPIMIQSLADLYILAQTVDPDTNAIFIAKDHLVASGAPSLAQAAMQLNIPLITSDEGSVIAGGAVAMGNKELDIGRRGGEMAIQLLEGAAPNEMPIRPVNTYTVFVNGGALERQGLTMEQIQRVAQELGYPVEVVQEDSE